MDTDTWHPLRGFKFHEPAKVQELAARLATLPQEMREPGRPLHDDLWTQAEAMKVVELFQRASGAEEAVTHIDLTRTRKITS